MYLEFAAAPDRVRTVDLLLARGTVPLPERQGLDSISERPARVGGRPGTHTLLGQGGTATVDELRWSPVGGVEAVLVSDGVGWEDTLAIAEAVRFDRATRCATPAQVTVLPAGATLRGCRIGPALSGSATFSTVVLTIGDGTAEIEVVAGNDLARAEKSSPTPEPVDGGRAGWYPESSMLVIYDLDGLFIRIVTHPGYGRAEAELVAGGLRRPATADPDRPETWSTALIG
ncbi:hypothetical protein Pflav_042890 [Phytohabitans flavus]|uniref:Uncharacterized protein n=2 Tax=Phytohabitans flavus TaxID=1076124 RepID=A0A6F8XVQ3_9ACTN|nr:hypothetical protein Pflav_042890 [Phytohabitans flavus]